MNDATVENWRAACEGGAGAIRRRHILYVCGSDPRGAEGYFDIFSKTCDRFRRLWPIALTVEPLQIDSDDFAHWQFTLQGARWRTQTRYDFLRSERFIRAEMARPILPLALQALLWTLDDLFSGTLMRIAFASWRFAAHLFWFQLIILAWWAAAAAAAVFAGQFALRGLAGHAGPAAAIAAIASVAAGGAVLIAFGPLARRWRVFQISTAWSTIRRFGRDRPTWIDQVVEVAARRVLAAVQANDADELVVVGHSSGGFVACAIMARALELDPELGRGRPRLVLLTLGSVMPAVALARAARRMRAIVARLASAPRLAWVDCQSRKDIMCFTNFDPVRGIGVRVDAPTGNPQRWRINFKLMFTPAAYNRMRRNYFRVHYQYIMGGDLPGCYDYILLTGGPAPIAEWPEYCWQLTDALRSEAAGNDDSHRKARVGAAG